MGQSKPLNPLDHLIAAAIEARKQKNNAGRNALDLPNGAQFAGYLIYVHSTKEFLNQVEDSPKRTIRTFAETPEHAYRLQSFAEASKLVMANNGESIVALFSLGPLLIVAQVNNELAGSSMGETLH